MKSSFFLMIIFLIGCGSSGGSNAAKSMSPNIVPDPTQYSPSSNGWLGTYTPHVNGPENDPLIQTLTTCQTISNGSDFTCQTTTPYVSACWNLSFTFTITVPQSGVGFSEGDFNIQGQPIDWIKSFSPNDSPNFTGTNIVYGNNIGVGIFEKIPGQVIVEWSGSCRVVYDVTQ